jgi:hypothetical protein
MIAGVADFYPFQLPPMLPPAELDEGKFGSRRNATVMPLLGKHRTCLRLKVGLSQQLRP